MYKIVIFGMLLAAANAGVIGGLGHGGLVLSHGSPSLLHAAPAVVHAAPAIAYKTSIATSYANSNSISINPHPVAVHSAPIVHAAPLIHSAPIVHAAPAPVIISHGLSHGLGLGGLGHGHY